jgi:4-diphosphocytidyl-2-C-methyl-D-erythritol kinase
MTSIRHECHKIHAFTNSQATVTRASLLPDSSSMSSSSRALLFSNARHGMRSMKSGRGEWSIQGSHSNSKLASGRCNIRAHASDTTTSSENKIEVVYNPQKRIDELTMELNSSSSVAVSNLTLFSPSKVNVFLRITGKRPDGYHDLASLFHVISLGDIIKFSISPSTTKDSLTTNASGVPLDEKNLIIKAFNLYRRKTGTQKYFWVHLDKQVPTGAGLGGGSGNAATALWAANQMNGNIASEKELQAWSAEIGSDCPFFFSQGAAYCTSRGEVVRDIAPPISLDTPMVLIKPKEECSTAEVYKLFSMERVSTKDPEELLREISQNGISQNVCINDLEPPAFEVLPALKALKERVAAAGRGRYQAVFMSGSGSTIVGVGDSEPPQFIYDEEQYRDTFISEAFFLTRKENEWYQQLIDNTCSIEEKTCL